MTLAWLSVAAALVLWPWPARVDRADRGAARRSTARGPSPTRRRAVRGIGPRSAADPRSAWARGRGAWPSWSLRSDAAQGAVAAGRVRARACWRSALAVGTAITAAWAAAGGSRVLRTARVSLALALGRGRARGRRAGRGRAAGGGRGGRRDRPPARSGSAQRRRSRSPGWRWPGRSASRTASRSSSCSAGCGPTWPIAVAGRRESATRGSPARRRRRRPGRIAAARRRARCRDGRRPARGLVRDAGRTGAAVPRCRARRRRGGLDARLICAGTGDDDRARRAWPRRSGSVRPWRWTARTGWTARAAHAAAGWGEPATAAPPAAELRLAAAAARSDRAPGSVAGLPLDAALIGAAPVRLPWLGERLRQVAGAVASRCRPAAGLAATCAEPRLAPPLVATAVRSATSGIRLAASLSELATELRAECAHLAVARAAARRRVGHRAARACASCRRSCASESSRSSSASRQPRSRTVAVDDLSDATVSVRRVLPPFGARCGTIGRARIARRTSRGPSMYEMEGPRSVSLHRRARSTRERRWWACVRDPGTWAVPTAVGRLPGPSRCLSRWPCGVCEWSRAQ